MSLSLNATNLAISPGLKSNFQASGGSEPYIYTVLPNGSGGTINSSSGLYAPPARVNEDPEKLYDTIVVVDSIADSSSLAILVGDPLLLLCNILQIEMDLPADRVYLWDQKKNEPKDNGIYIIVSEMNPRPLANVNRLNSAGESEQYVVMNTIVQVDIKSRGPGARMRKEEIILALNSNYSESQQEKNSFQIGRIPPGKRFVNLSQIDGMAIPYRYTIDVSIQYAFKKSKAAPYFSSFPTASVLIDP